jgi:hypothetical protein
MLEGWANDVVIALAGIVVGALLSAAGLLSPISQSELTRKPEEGFWAWQTRRRQLQQERLADAPRSYSLVSFAFFGFLVVFIVAIVASPLQMRWWFFLAGFVAAYAFGSLLPTLVRAGKVPAATNEPLLTALRHAISSTRRTEPPASQSSDAGS